jgi:hypothetical protein
MSLWVICWRGYRCTQFQNGTLIYVYLGRPIFLHIQATIWKRKSYTLAALKFPVVNADTIRGISHLGVSLSRRSASFLPGPGQSFAQG